MIELAGVEVIVDKSVVVIDPLTGTIEEVMIVDDKTIRGVIAEMKEIEDTTGDLVEMIDRTVAVPEVQTEILIDDVMIATEIYVKIFAFMSRKSYV